MKRKSKSYPAFFYRQRPAAPVQCSLVASTADIDEWASVPEKRGDDIRKFQRPEIKKHVSEINDFFSKFDENSSPTAIVVGFAKPDRLTSIDAYGNTIDFSKIKEGEIVSGHLNITYIEFDPTVNDEEKRNLYNQLLLEITPIIEAEIKALELSGDIVETDSNSETGRNNDSERYENEDGDGDGDGDEDEEDDDDEEYNGNEIDFETAILAKRKLLAELKSENPNKLSGQDLDALLGTLINLDKPGIIIDGQHRVSGTKSRKVTFNVITLPDAPWQELAFQFVVLNMAAKKVDDSLLINIIGNSLTDEERSTIDERLHNSGIKVPLYLGVMQLHKEIDSPFRGKLKFGIKGESGIIEAKAAKSKIISYWYSCGMYKLVSHLLEGSSQKEKKANWIESGLWMEHLKLFWNRAKFAYEDHELWSDVLNNDGKTPASPLMRVTVIDLIQRTILDYMIQTLESKIKNDPDGKVSMNKLLPDPEEFAKYYDMYFKRLIPGFFTEWGDAAKGLDGSIAVKKGFIEAVKKVISGDAKVQNLKANKEFIFGSRA